jgi:hypothetical protein
MSVEVAPSILNFVQSGTYPESEQIVTTELTPSALQAVLDELERARNDVKVRAVIF